MASVHPILRSQPSQNATPRHEDAASMQRRKYFSDCLLAIQSTVCNKTPYCGPFHKQDPPNLALAYPVSFSLLLLRLIVVFAQNLLLSQPLPSIHMFQMAYCRTKANFRILSCEVCVTSWSLGQTRRGRSERESTPPALELPFCPKQRESSEWRACPARADTRVVKLSPNVGESQNCER